jgi:hypothetical protein
MFKCQIDVINATIDFLLSEDFNSAKTGKEYKYYLPKEVQAQIKKELGI